MTKTVRDLEATFKDWGYSNRRAKAGAAAAWKALGAPEEPPPSPEEQATANLETFAALLAAELRKPKDD